MSKNKTRKANHATTTVAEPVTTTTAIAAVEPTTTPVTEPAVIMNALDAMIANPDDVAIDSKVLLAGTVIEQSPATVADAIAALYTPQPVRATVPTTFSKGKLPLSYVIRLLVPANPKRKGSASYDRYALYVDGMTVGQAIAAGLWRVDFDWDLKHGHISVHPPVAAEPVTVTAAQAGAVPNPATTTA
jgi:hypothetical protein